MDYLQSTYSQILLLLRCVGFGALLAAAYEVLRFLRLLFCPRRSAFVWDVSFGALAGTSAFLFDLLYCDGEIRAFVLLAQCAGFLIWYVLSAAALRRRTDCFPAVLRRAAARFALPLMRAERLASAWADAGRKKCGNFLKKLQKNINSS